MCVTITASAGQRFISSEMGYELGSVPSFREHEIKWILDLYARYPNIIGAAFWCLQSYQGEPISKQANAYMEPLARLSAEWTPPEQFANTIPPEPEPGEKNPTAPVIDIVGTFPIDGLPVWRWDALGYAGTDNGRHMETNGYPRKRWTDKNNVQVPTEFTMSWTEAGDFREPEGRHMMQPYFAAEQQRHPFLNLVGGYDPTGSPLGGSYKLFTHGGRFDFEIVKNAPLKLNRGRYALVAWCYLHTEKDGRANGDYPFDLLEVGLQIATKSADDEIIDSAVHLLPLEDGHITLEFSVEKDQDIYPSWYFTTNYAQEEGNSQSLFIKSLALYRIGNIPDDAPEPIELPTLEAHLEHAAEAHRVIDYNAIAALERAIVADEHVPFTAEFRTTYKGREYAAQGARLLGTNYKRVYFAEVGDWGNVQSRQIGDERAASRGEASGAGRPCDQCAVCVTARRRCSRPERLRSGLRCDDY